ncbi:hypothetical protein LSAT2_008035, partial [Lamellibrachia satsuma]
TKEWNSNLDKLTDRLNNSQNTLVSRLGKIKVCTENGFHIGEGTSGTCAYLGLLCTDDKNNVVKEVVKKVPENRNKESEILSCLEDHNNIVEYKAGRDVDDRIYTVFLLCDFTLEAWVRDNKTTTDWESRTPNMVRQLLETLRYLHENRIVRCDLTVSF